MIDLMTFIMIATLIAAVVIVRIWFKTVVWTVVLAIGIVAMMLWWFFR